VARNPVGSDQRWDAARNPVGSPCFPEDYPLPHSAVSPVELLSPDSAVADAAAAFPVSAPEFLAASAAVAAAPRSRARAVPR